MRTGGTHGCQANVGGDPGTVSDLAVVRAQRPQPFRRRSRPAGVYVFGGGKSLSDINKQVKRRSRAGNRHDHGRIGKKQSLKFVHQHIGNEAIADIEILELGGSVLNDMTNADGGLQAAVQTLVDSGILVSNAGSSLTPEMPVSHPEISTMLCRVLTYLRYFR